MQHGNVGLRFPGTLRHGRPGGQRKHRRSKTDPMNTAVSSIPRTSVPNARAKAIRDTPGHPQAGHRARRMSDSSTACASGKATGGGWESQGKSTARTRTDEQACKSASCISGTKSRTRIPRESLENASSSNHCVAVPTLPGTAPTIPPPSSSLSPSAWYHHPVQPCLYPGQCPFGNPTQLHTLQCPPSNPGHMVLPFEPLKSTEISCHAHTMQHRPKGQAELAVKTLPTATQLQGFVFRPATSTHTMTHPQTGPHGLCGNTGHTSAIPAQPKVFAPPTPHSDKTRKRTHSKMASELPLRLNDVESGVPLQSVSDNLLSLVHMMQHSLQETLRRLKGSGMYTVNRTVYATCSVLIHRRADVVKAKPLPISYGCDQSQICAWERMSQCIVQKGCCSSFPTVCI